MAHPVTEDEKHRFTSVQGLAALSLDALSLVACGPEAILVVLVAAGTVGLHYWLPVTGAIIVLLAALVVSYRQVIEAFPSGGGAYAVSKQWRPNVPLVTLHTAHRSIAKPIVKYLRDIEAKDRYHPIVVLIPEVQPPKFWDYLQFNQRGTILDRAINRGPVNAVLCSLEQFAPHEAGPGSAAAPPSTAPPSTAPPSTAPPSERSARQLKPCPTAK